MGEKIGGLEWDSNKNWRDIKMERYVIKYNGNYLFFQGMDWQLDEKLFSVFETREDVLDMLSDGIETEDNEITKDNCQIVKLIITEE